MPRCHEALPYVKLGKSEAFEKALRSEKVRRLERETFDAALAAGLSRRQARAVILANRAVVLAIVEQPAREAEIMRKADRATVGVFVAARAGRVAA